ncbi:glycosyltransferase family 2 protein, partial [Patescibacteria group bacterium]|nr:glycosyltransferase family 2 protein [Patescibacteria group bacterium]MBU1870960.1 glycosyltransferase family 2 protein [Patescibacteria group bacterium]
MRLYIGFITYSESTIKYLPYFLLSLRNQTYKDYKIIAIDNSEEKNNKNVVYIKNNFSEIDLKWAGENLGFAKAYNLMINQAIKDNAEYFLCINPDMILEPDMIEKLIKAIEKDEKIGALQPKILKWDFENNIKTKIVDSYGIICDQKFRFKDDAQGQIDIDKNNITKDIFGFTGAAGLIRLTALQDTSFFNGKNIEYFDELMFMYKEDCDLSLRLRLSGWKIVLIGSAIAYHDREASRMGDSIWQIIQNRRGKKRKIKQWSFFNQWIITLKYCNLAFSLETKFWLWWYQLEVLIFTILFEQYWLKELIKLWKLKNEIKKRKEQLKIKIDIKEIEK